MPDDNVLLVDSELLTRDLLGNHLKHMGFRVFAVDNSSAALKLIPQTRFRLAVVNEKVGDKSLQEIIAGLKSHDADAQVFLITPQAREAGYLEGKGLYDSFVKPFRLEEVTLKLRHAVENISLRRALRVSVEKVQRLERELAAYDDAAEEVAIPDLSSLESEPAEAQSGGENSAQQEPKEAAARESGDDGEVLDDVFEKIRKLDILRKAGILTSGEFNRKKKELLDRI